VHGSFLTRSSYLENARPCVREVGGLCIPFVYLAQSGTSHEEMPWLRFPVDGVMVSAYGFMTSRRKMENAESRGLSDILEFDGPIMLDSGGFQHLKGKEISYNPADLVDFARRSEASYLFALDYPPRSYDDNFTLISKKNFRNYLVMAARSEVIPVVHAPLKLAMKEIRLLKPLHPPYVGVGGLVPSLRGWMKMTLETIDLVRTELPDSHLHLLGFGAPRAGSEHLRKAYSVDYCGWRTAAATSYLLTPNGYRKIGERNKSGHAARPNRAIYSLIRVVCKKLGIDRRKLTRDFASRAIFNAYVATRVLKGRPL
jgi:hypothetical protein